MKRVPVSLIPIFLLLVLSAFAPLALPPSSSAQQGCIPSLGQTCMTTVGYIHGTISISYNYPLRAGGCILYVNGSGGNPCSLLVGVFSGEGTGTFNIPIMDVEEGGNPNIPPISYLAIGFATGSLTGTWNEVGSSPCNGTVEGNWNELLNGTGIWLSDVNLATISSGRLYVANDTLYAEVSMTPHDYFNATGGSWAPPPSWHTTYPWGIACPFSGQGASPGPFGGVGPSTNGVCSTATCSLGGYAPFYDITFPLWGLHATTRQFNYTMASLAPPPLPPSPWFYRYSNGTVAYFKDYTGAFSATITSMDVPLPHPIIEFWNASNGQLILNDSISVKNYVQLDVSIAGTGLLIPEDWPYQFSWSFPSGATCFVNNSNYYATCDFSHSGIYLINATARDPIGMMLPITQTFTVFDNMNGSTHTTMTTITTTTSSSQISSSQTGTTTAKGASYSVAFADFVVIIMVGVVVSAVVVGLIYRVFHSKPRTGSPSLPVED